MMRIESVVMMGMAEKKMADSEAKQSMVMMATLWTMPMVGVVVVMLVEEYLVHEEFPILMQVVVVEVGSVDEDE